MLRTISPSKSSDSKGTRCSVLKGTGAPSGWPSRRCCCGPGAGGAAGGGGAASVPGRGRGLWGGDGFVVVRQSTRSIDAASFPS